MKLKINRLIAPLLTLLAASACTSNVADSSATDTLSAGASELTILPPPRPRIPFPDIPAYTVSPATLLVVTSDALAPTVDRLLLHKRARGMTAAVVTVSQARSSFSASDAPEATKRAILDFVQHGGTRYVMLAGDASHVPVRHRRVRSATDATVTLSENPSDLFYANLYKSHDADASHHGDFDNWDGNGNHEYNEEAWGDASITNDDHVDGYPDIAVGRVPAADATELGTYIDKVIRYETWGTAMPGARTTAYLIDRDYPTADTMALGIEGPMVTSRARNIHIGLSYGWDETPPAPFTRGELGDVSLVANKASLLFYVGHGWVDGWLYNGGLPGWVFNTYRNLDNYPVVVASACETGQFSPNLPPAATPPNPFNAQRSLASDWLFPTSGAGAIAYFGESVVAPNNWGAEMGRDISRLASAGTPILGDVWRGAQARYWRTVGGADAIGAPRIYLGVMTMFGDPSLRLALAPANKQTLRQNDFDGDGKADLGVRRPLRGGWSVANVTTPTFLGDTTDIPVTGDYDGDGKSDLALWRRTTGDWLVRASTSGASQVAFGTVGDLPVPADYDGDGKTDIAVWRPSEGNWYVRGTEGGFSETWGVAGDVPVPADYDADGSADIAIWRPSTGTWYLRTTTDAWSSAQYGIAGDVPAPADYDGDGKADIAVFRPSTGTWFLRTTASAWQQIQYGVAGDVPVPADYDGDGKADIAVWRPSNGHFYLRTTTAPWQEVAFGQAGDIPLGRLPGNAP